MAAAEDRVCTPVSNAELERRWSATRARMRETGIEALVVSGAQDWMNGYIRWFTGLPANNGYPRSVVFSAEGAMTLVEQGPFNGELKLDGKDTASRGIGKKLFTPSFIGAVAYTGGYDAELLAREIRKAGCRSVGLVCAVGM